MKKRIMRRLRVGEYVGDVKVEVRDGQSPLNTWAPYLSPDEARKFDDVRQALRRGDLKAASKHGRVYRLSPVEI